VATKLQKPEESCENKCSSRGFLAERKGEKEEGFSKERRKKGGEVVPVFQMGGGKKRRASCRKATTGSLVRKKGKYVPKGGGDRVLLYGPAARNPFQMNEEKSSENRGEGKEERVKEAGREKGVLLTEDQSTNYKGKEKQEGKRN